MKTWIVDFLKFGLYFTGWSVIFGATFLGAKVAAGALKIGQTVGTKKE